MALSAAENCSASFSMIAASMVGNHRRLAEGNNHEMSVSQVSSGAGFSSPSFISLHERAA
jgi:hypothetical protein